MELERRTKAFAVKVIRLVDTFPRGTAALIIARQLISSACSVGANYREANRAESHADFAHKMATVEKESSEAEYWLGLSIEVNLVGGEAANDAYREAGELLRIFTSATRTMKKRPKPNPDRKPTSGG